MFQFMSSKFILVISYRKEKRKGKKVIMQKKDKNIIKKRKIENKK